MKKTFRRSQMKDVLGHQVGGLTQCELGFPYRGASGVFFPHKADDIDLMFVMIEKHPEFHIVSQMPGGWLYNRYDEKAKYYFVYRGNADPDIEFSNEYDPDDYTPEERERSQKFLEEFRSKPWSPMQVAAVNWMLENVRKKA